MKKDKLPGDFFKEDGPVTPLLYALYSLVYESSERATNDNLYKAYKLVCRDYGVKPVDQDSMTKIVSKLIKIGALKAVPKGVRENERIISFDKLK